jgi:hypothetical protein
MRYPNLENFVTFIVSGYINEVLENNTMLKLKKYGFIKGKSVVMNVSI